MPSRIQVEFMQQGESQDEFGLIIRTEDGSPVTGDHGQMILDAVSEILLMEGFMFVPRKLEELDS